MSHSIIITITNEPVSVDGGHEVYDYNDRILKNIFSSTHEIYYSGQNTARNDHILVNAIKQKHPFKVYYREKKKMSFTYLGVSTQIEKIKSRTKDVGNIQNTRT